MSSSRNQLAGHLQEYEIERPEKIRAEGANLGRLKGFLSELQQSMTLKEGSSDQVSLFQGITAQLSNALLNKMRTYTFFLKDKEILEEQIREWVSVECARIFFQLGFDESGKKSILSDDKSLYPSPAGSLAIEKPIAEGQRIENLTLMQRIILNIRLRSALNVGPTIQHPKPGKNFFTVLTSPDNNPLVLDKGVVKPFASIMHSRFSSLGEGFAAHEKYRRDHAHLLSDDDDLPIPFVQFYELQKAPKTGAETLETEDSSDMEASIATSHKPGELQTREPQKPEAGESDTEESDTEESDTKETTPSFANLLRESFNSTFYVYDKEDEERSFIHYFLGVPKRKELPSGWSTFFLGWDILFYVAGMWLIAPLKNIIKLATEFLPLAAAYMFLRLGTWMVKKDFNVGAFVCTTGLFAICGALWFVGRALTSPLTSLKDAARIGKKAREYDLVSGWFVTIFLVGISAAISLAGVLSIAAVSSVFFPAVAGTVIGEGLAATVPAIAPPIAAAAAGVVVAGDQAMQSCCTTSRLMGGLQLDSLPRNSRSSNDDEQTDKDVPKKSGSSNDGETEEEVRTGEQQRSNRPEW